MNENVLFLVEKGFLVCEENFSIAKPKDRELTEKEKEILKDFQKKGFTIQEQIF